MESTKMTENTMVPETRKKVGQAAPDQSDIELEQAKWDSYYASLPLVDEDAATRQFNDAFAGMITELLPSGGSVLEAGCGGGWQSLAIARSGVHRVSLLDFSQEALNYAKRLFDREHLRADFVQGDVFAPANGEYDLVFNAGVLEHYTFDEQVAFIRAMAQRSGRFVLAMVPNRLCYWYWLWRIQRASKADWPFGKEVPMADLSAAFEAAGLKFLGHAFLGESWTEGMIENMTGIDQTLKNQILAVHRTKVVSQVQRGYLVAALGSVQKDDQVASASWSLNSFQDSFSQSEFTAAIADSLALRLAADQQLAEIEPERAAIRRERVEMVQVRAELTQVRQDRDRAVQLASRSAELQLLAQRAAHSEAIYREQMRQLEARRRRPLSSFFDFAWAFARSFSYLLPRSAREPAKAIFYKTLGRLRPHSERYLRYLEWRRHLDAINSATIVEAEPDLTGGGPKPYDVFVFPVIDWEFRHQRPQQLALQFAERGHRVYYFRTTFSSTEAYEPVVRLVAPNVFTVSLPCTGKPPVIYSESLDPAQLDSVVSGIEQLRTRFSIGAAVSVVDHPFWAPVCGRLTNHRVVYDCMDHHAGFSNNNSNVLSQESRLLGSADLVVASSAKLFEMVKASSAHPLLVRNAGQYDHFCTAPAKLAFEKTRPVIGYYGAISEWFDAELVAQAARQMPECDFVLVGSTYGANLLPVKDLPNVRLFGEVPYTDLPGYLHGFDVCMIPFQVNELTLATNPVKVYEYLSAGKPVVSIDLPELALMKDVIETAATTEAFVAGLRKALTDNAPARVEARRAFARENTWAKRGEVLDAALNALFPKVSVIVLTFNQLEFTQRCLASLERFTQYPNWELIIVDNASTDGTPKFLEDFAKDRPYVRLTLNRTNVGFAAGNNQGARSADGEFLVFLNNDTYVTAGWLGDMLVHFGAEPNLGLLNPVTNNIGNEAKIDLAYTTMAEMAIAAKAYTLKHAKVRLALTGAAFFCVMLRRRVWEDIGELDEKYGMGFFEDDDYSMRARKKGYSLACADDVFVHHHLSASFNKLADERRKELFERNKRYFESKWGPWQPHKYRK
jgi:GT2 family glycosyltransferase/glycosyltransferase involved in cell wall biosynthesis/SAM-dependent methyltransferase